MYYLQSRYYDPEIGRFLNADDAEFACVTDLFCFTGLFNYCMNCPTIYCDFLGYLPNILKFFRSLRRRVQKRIKLLVRKFYRWIQRVRDRNSVTVIMAKNDGDWYESSRVMGNTLCKELDALKIKILKVDSSNFLKSWKKINSHYVIIHTHGAPNGLYDSKGAIITVEQTDKMAKNDKIKLVVCTACSTAASNGEKKNIATVLSKKINNKGITFANKYTVVGGDREFAGIFDGKIVDGWICYKNGKIINADVSETLTMELAGQIYKDLK